MKIRVTILLIIFFLFYTSLSLADKNWQEIRSEHFIIYFQEPAKEFADAVSAKAEEYYNSVSRDLGYVRYENFWKWENRVKIYLYPDHSSYTAGSGARSWSHGVADYKNKLIISYVGSSEFLNTLLVHEITHLIFRDFVGFRGNIPLWLDEGVAQWEEENTRPARIYAIKSLAQKEQLFSLESMMQLDVREINAGEYILVSRLHGDSGEKSKVRIKGDELVKIYYLQAFSLIGFLIERFGADNFIIFSRQLRDGKDMNEALKFAYPTQIRSLSELETQWDEYLLQ